MQCMRYAYIKTLFVFLKFKCTWYLVFLCAKSDNSVSLGTPYYHWEQLAIVALMWVIFLSRQKHLVYLAGVCLLLWMPY